MNSIFKFCLFVCLSLLFSCDIPDCKLKVHNKEKYTIYAVDEFDWASIKDRTCIYIKNHKIQSDSIHMMCVVASWKGAIERNNNVLKVYFIDSASYEKYLMDTTVMDFKYFEYQYTLSQIEKMNWTIIFKEK